MSIKILEDEPAMMRLVSGCLKDTFNAHGPIGWAEIPSATKRIGKQILAVLRDTAAEPGFMDGVRALLLNSLRRELTLSRKKVDVLRRQERRFRHKLVEAGIPLGDVREEVAHA